jgi:type IV secretory pathway TrbF-like protein
MDTTELGPPATQGAPPTERPADRLFTRLLSYEADNSDRARERLIYLCVTASLMFLFLLLWLGEHFNRGTIEPFVQVAQVTEGKIDLHGPPVKLLEWQPEESHIHDMLTDWIRNTYSRSTDVDTQKVNQHWVDRHTCGPAMHHLRSERRAEGARHVRLHRKVQIGLRKVEKTAAPKQYHVVWQEIETYAHMDTQTKMFSSVLTVGRVKPTDREWAAWNKAGLCVDTFSAKKEL